MTDKELLERAHQYFNNADVLKMYYTPDGSFFYGTQDGKNYAFSHANSHKWEVATLTRSDYNKLAGGTKSSTVDKPVVAEVAEKDYNGVAMAELTADDVSEEDRAAYFDSQEKKAVHLGKVTKGFKAWWQDQ